MDFKTVKSTHSRMEAELIRGHLEAEGIRVILKPTTEPYGGEAYFGDSAGVEIQVPVNQFTRAYFIIKDVENSMGEGEINDNA